MKPIEEYPFCKSIAGKIYLRGTCKKCRRQLSDNWKKNNAVSIREYSRRNRNPNDYRDRIEYHRNYRQGIVSRLSKINNNTKRKALYSDTDITTEFLRELWDKTTYCCITGIKLENHGQYPNGKHLDHIIPLNIGGTHTKDNVRYISAFANINRPKNGSDEIIKAILFINIIRKLNKK